MNQELSVNAALSHYRVVSRIGAGGMGEVYLAEDTRLERKVALKVLPPEVADDEDRVRRFQQEARAASALNHPNIITVYDVGSFGRTRYIATEFVQGETLRRRLGGAPLPTREALDIAVQVASALDAAHGAGIVHRDVKPENIMVRPDGLVKVLDFGLAKQYAPASGAVDREAETLARNMTRPGLILGTLVYMSPEQVRGQPLDARTDVFSLGAVLYELLTGTCPFDRPTRGDVIAAVLTEAPPLEGLPPGLRAVVARALQKERGERYQTSRELLDDLKSLGRELELTAGNGRVVTTPDAPAEATAVIAAPAARRFRPVHALAILLLAGLAAAAAVWWLALRREAPAPASFRTAEVAAWRSAPGEVYSTGSFSPDGARVAFVTNAAGSPNIYVKQTAANTPPVQITKDGSRNDLPVWSPDGEEIAFFSTRGGQPGLWRVPYLGGPPTLLKTVGPGGARPRLWSKGGALYYTEKGNLFALDLKSGQTGQLTDLGPAATDANSLSVSPDEKWIAYVSAEGERWGVSVAPARGGGAARRVVEGAAEVRNTVWHADGRRVLYSALADGVFQLFAVGAEGGAPAQLTFGDRDSYALDVSADGSKILYGSSKEESDVWGVSLTTGEEFALTSDLSSELWPAVAPDGRAVAYSSVRNLSQGDKLASGTIMLKPADPDAPPSPLVADAFLPAWSPDGQQLAFMRFAGGAYNLWAVRALGGEARQLTRDGVPSVSFSVLPYNRTQASDFGWSPDGARLVYGSKRSGAQNLWLVSADGATDQQLTSNEDADTSLQCPLWSPDGRSVAYTSRPNRAADGRRVTRLWLIDVETRAARAVYEAESFFRLLGWSEGGRGLVVASVGGREGGAPLPEIGVAEVSPASGEGRPLAKLQTAYLYNLHLSPDGRTLAYAAQAEGRDNLWVVPLRGGAARKVTANNDARLYFSSLAWSPDGRAIYFGKQSRHSLLSMVTNFR